MKFTHRLRHQHLLNFRTHCILLWLSWFHFDQRGSCSLLCWLKSFKTIRLLNYDTYKTVKQLTEKAFASTTKQLSCGVFPSWPLFQIHPHDLTGAWATAACGRSATDSVLQCHVAQEGPMMFGVWSGEAQETSENCSTRIVVSWLCQIVTYMYGGFLNWWYPPNHPF